VREFSESLPTLGSDEVQLISRGQTLHLYEVQDIEHWWLVAHPRRMTERELAELLLEHTLPLVTELEALEAEFQRAHGLTPAAAERAPYQSETRKLHNEWFNGRAGTLIMEALTIALKSAGFFHVEMRATTLGVGEEPRMLQRTLEEAYCG